MTAAEPLDDARRVTYPVALARAAMVWLGVVPGGVVLLVRGFGQTRAAEGSTFGLFALVGCLGLGLSLVAGARALVTASLAGPAGALTVVAAAVLTLGVLAGAVAAGLDVVGVDALLALTGGSIIGWVAAVGYVLMLGDDRPTGGAYLPVASRSSSSWHIR